MTVVLMVISIGLIFWVLLMLKAIDEATNEALSFIRHMASALSDVSGSLAALSDDVAAQVRTQKAVSSDVLTRLEKAADQGVASARHLADDLADREEMIDAAREGVADDLAAAQQRADETVGEPGAAADAAVKTPEEDDST
jgi:hypothetical protein